MRKLNSNSRVAALESSHGRKPVVASSAADKPRSGERFFRPSGSQFSETQPRPCGRGYILPPLLGCICLGLVGLLFSGCGYRLANKKLKNGEGQTIAVPTFTNRTTTYRIEQRLTEAVRRELLRRTRFKVSTEQSGDVVMAGEVLSYTAVPIIFNEQGRGSSYSILVDLYVRLTDSKTGAVVFQSDRWTFREVFELAQNSAEFVPEDTAAIDRLARRFASSLVASVLRAR